MPSCLLTAFYPPRIRRSLYFLRFLLFVCFLLLGARGELPGQTEATPSESAAAQTGQVIQKDTATAEPSAGKDEPESPAFFSDYFEAHDAAFASNKHVLVYRFDAENPSAEQVEFETETLCDPDIRQALEGQFVVARIAAGDPIQVRSTVRRSGTVRRGFRQVSTSWTEVVRKDLFDESTSSPGLLLVRIAGENYRSGAEAVASFPFGEPRLSPHVFQRVEQFDPWTAATFRKIVATPIAPAAEYLPHLSGQLGLDNPVVFQAPADNVADLGGIAYDYVGDQVAMDRVAVKLHIGGNGQLAAFEKPIDTRIDVYSLKDSAIPVHYVYRQVQPTDEWQDLHVDGLEPETAYRLRIYFYRDEPARTLIGEARHPLYVATGGETRLANARAAIALRALGEVDDWNRGRTRGKDYLVGRWCERFYSWNIAKHVRTAYQHGYDPRTFSRHNAIISGTELRRVARNGNIMGDHVRIQGHGFMVLSYDRHLGKVWTIEGNFGNRAVLTTRQVQNHWSVGTLVDSMLREERPPAPAEEVAAAEESGERDG